MKKVSYSQGTTGQPGAKQQQQTYSRLNLSSLKKKKKTILLNLACVQPPPPPHLDIFLKGGGVLYTG